MDSDPQYILDENLELVHDLYAHAVADGMKEPAILVFDLRDERARFLGATQSSEERVNAIIEEHAQSGLIPTMLLTCEHPDAAKVMYHGEEPPLHHPAVLPPPPGEFLVVVMGSGKRFSAYVPKPD